MKTLLIVEDEESDVLFMKRVCENTSQGVELFWVSDGEAAINYLAGNGEYRDRGKHPLPDLIFLDIKLPRKTGHEVLNWIRGQPEIPPVPVIMFSSSAEHTDVDRSYRLGANSYLRKPDTPSELRQLMTEVFKYWLRINIAPSIPS